MKNLSIITLCTLLTVGSYQFIQTISEESAPVGEKSYTQAEHDQVVADHQATMAKQQKILESDKSSSADKNNAKETMKDSKLNVMESHAKLQANSGGLDLSHLQYSHSAWDANAKTMKQDITTADGKATVTTKFDAKTGKAIASTTTDINTEEVTSATEYSTDPDGSEIVTTMDRTGDKVIKITRKDGTKETHSIKANGDSVTEEIYKDGRKSVFTITEEETIYVFTDKSGTERTQITDKVTGKTKNTTVSTDKKGNETTDSVTKNKDGTELSRTKTTLTKDQVAARDSAPKVEAAKEVNKTDTEKKTEAKVIELEAKALNVTTPEEGQAVIADAVGVMADAMGIKDPTTIKQVKTKMATDTKGADVSNPSIFKQIMDAISRMLGISAPAPVAKQVNLFQA